MERADDDGLLELSLRLAGTPLGPRNSAHRALPLLAAEIRITA